MLDIYSFSQNACPRSSCFIYLKVKQRPLVAKDKSQKRAKSVCHTVKSVYQKCLCLVDGLYSISTKISLNLNDSLITDLNKRENQCLQQ